MVADSTVTEAGDGDSAGGDEEGGGDEGGDDDEEEEEEEEEEEPEDIKPKLEDGTLNMNGLGSSQTSCKDSIARALGQFG